MLRNNISKPSVSKTKHSISEFWESVNSRPANKEGHSRANESRCRDEAIPNNGAAFFRGIRDTASFMIALHRLPRGFTAVFRRAKRTEYRVADNKRRSRLNGRRYDVTSWERAMVRYVERRVYSFVYYPSLTVSSAVWLCRSAII